MTEVQSTIGNRRTITGLPPDAKVGIPHFTSRWLRGESIEVIVEAMIERYPQFAFIREGNYKIAYAWKLRGGSSKGKPVYGRVTKPGGYFDDASGATWLIEMSADHCAELSNWQFEARVHHELCKLGEFQAEEDEDGNNPPPTPVIVGPDLSLFTENLNLYGWHSAEMQAASGPIAKQLRLEMDSMPAPVQATSAKRGPGRPRKEDAAESFATTDTPDVDWSAEIESLKADDDAAFGSD